MNDKLKDLQKRINKIAHKKEAKPAQTNNDSYIVATELVAGVLVGTIIGVFVDKMFDTKPIFLIICLLIGIVASFKTIWYKINKK